MPKISIIVPVYNVECYLKECIESVLMQDYKDYELILIDDGSTDSSGRICDEYEDIEHVRILHTSNHGVSFARNTGLKEAAGEYIMFLDSDDLLSGTSVLCQIISEVKKHPDDLLKYGLCNFNSGKNCKSISEQNGELCSSIIIDKETICSAVHGGFVTQYIFPRAAISGVSFDENVGCGEDVIFLAEILSKLERLYVLNRVVYLRRIREGSITHSSFGKKDFDEQIYVHSEVKKRLKRIPGSGSRIVEAMIADQTVAMYRTKMSPQNRNQNIKRIKGRMKKNFPSFLWNPYLSKKTRGILLLFLVSPQLYFWAHSIAHYKNNKCL